MAELAATDQSEPLQEAEEEALPFGLVPGVYRIIRDTDITADRSVSSGDIGEVREGAAVTVFSVTVLKEERRIRGLVDDPPGWISLMSLGGSLCWATPVLCGVYCMVAGADVSAGVSVSSEDTAALEEGRLVNVVEVVHCRPEGRVRGHIDSPPGWISLLNTENGGQWAVHVEQEDAQVRDVLSREPGLFGTCTLSYSATRRALRRSHKKLNAVHKEATDAWRAPLSLFAQAAEAQARERGVPEWAIECVYKMQQLVDVAAELQDLADVYEAQINTAERSGTGLHRASLRIQLERLEDLSQQLRANTPQLRAAREAFDTPDTAPQQAPVLVEDLAVSPGTARAGREVIIQKPSAIGQTVATASRKVWRSLSSRLSTALSPTNGGEAACEACEPTGSSDSEGSRRLRRVVVRAGSWVYSLSFEYSDGTARTSLSGWGGEEQEPFVLEAGEFLVGVRGRQGLCLDAISFVTSRNRESAMFGKPENGDSEFCLDATEGFQIWCIERNFAGRIQRAIEIPAPSP